MFKVGFTGTRKGMTAQQAMWVEAFLVAQDDRIVSAHHGDCEGSDEQFHMICRRLGIPVKIHPPEDDKLRAYCEGAVLVHPPKPFLVRNRDIVDVSHWLVATPKEKAEPRPGRGQGTWSTVRYARKQHVETFTILPSGVLAL